MLLFIFNFYSMSLKHLCCINHTEIFHQAHSMLSNTLIMAKETSLCFFFLSFLITSSSGSLVGFSYHERGDTSTSTLSAGYLSFLQKTKLSPSQIRIHVTDHRILSTLSITNSNVSVDFYLNKTLVEKFITSKPSVISWLKHHISNLLPQLDIKTIIVSCGSECFTQNEIPSLVSALRSVHLALSKLHIAREVKVSVAFPLSFLEKLNASCEKDLSSILSFIKEVKSFVIIEDTLSAELSITGNHFVQFITKRASLAASILPCKDVPLVMTIKSLVIPPSSGEVAQFRDRVFKFLEARTDITKRIVALYAEVHTREDYAQKELKREEDLDKVIILSKSHKRRILDDITNPTNPTSGTTPIITTPDTPTIITVPSTNNPVTISPANPATMPVTIPSTTPVPLPPTNPATNPVTSYPPPSSSGSVPAVNQQPPPATANAPPATQGQSWCVAKNGAPETALQAALDYACGMGGADCSQIQQGGSCYNPVTLQSHASFAFNSYYQKHPASTSCDFGGTATIVSTNPSSGSCIFPSSSSTSTSSSPTTPTTSSPTIPTPSISAPPSNPTTPPASTPTAPPTSVPTTPSTTSSSTSGPGTSGYGTPPFVLNSSNPTSSSSSGTMPTGFGFQTPPDVNTTTSSSSHSATQRSLVGYIVLVISFVTARLCLRP